MATLQKFKFLAAHCAMVGSPKRSPTASPVVHLRRRSKTLRMLLGRSSTRRHHKVRFHRREDSPDRLITDAESAQQHRISVRSKLKDLLVSSPPPSLDGSAKETEQGEIRRLLPATGCAAEGGGGGCGGLTVGRRIGAGAMRPLSATLRQRLLRRAWRPVLVAIPEHSP